MHLKKHSLSATRNSSTVFTVDKKAAASFLAEIFSPRSLAAFRIIPGEAAETLASVVCENIVKGGKLPSRERERGEEREEGSLEETSSYQPAKNQTRIIYLLGGGEQAWKQFIILSPNENSLSSSHRQTNDPFSEHE